MKRTPDRQVGRIAKVYKPGNAEPTALQKFDRMNAYIAANGGFITSIPGAERIEFECLLTSPLPGQLRDAGYIVDEDHPSETTRVLACAIEERLALTSSGAFETLTETSTKVVASTIRHSGFVKMARFRFDL